MARWLRRERQRVAGSEVELLLNTNEGNHQKGRLFMKRTLLISLALFGVFVLGGSSLPATEVRATEKVDTALVEFPEPVKLAGVLLRGEYLIVHDEALMAKGMACTYIYRGKERIESNLVTSFHCIHADREEVKTFTVSFKRQPFGLKEITEIQFAGSRDGHIVP
jgi:hypothetical protein